MPPDLEAIRMARDAAEGELLERPGVTGIDVGRKNVADAPTQELAIRVYVAKKLPPHAIAQGALIPAEIQGVRTDVIERTFELHHLAPSFLLHADTGRYDPLAGGISIGPCKRTNGQFRAGTFGGCVVDNGTDEILFLSSFHSMTIGPAWQPGDGVAQPSRVDGGICAADTAGQLKRAKLTDEVDCAVAVPPGRRVVNRIVDIGPVTGAVRAVIGLPVRKRGRTTALTFGVVDSVYLTVRVHSGSPSGPLLFRNQIGIVVDPGRSSRFGLPGDSGALVVDESARAVGLYVAGTPDGTFAVANHIEAVLTALDVRLCLAPAKSGPKEKAEVKDKPEKPEKWEGKPEGKGEAKPEVKPEKWEAKPEKPEPGESKGWTPKDHTDWEIWRWKQINNKEPGKETEVKVGDLPGLPKSPGGEDPLGEVKEEIARLRHFIERNLRPDLTGGALKWEADVDETDPG
jgi:hypothetical protein